MKWCLLACEHNDGAQAQRLQGGLRSFFRQRRNHDDGLRLGDHDVGQARDPIHFRHVDIEGDNIGIETVKERKRLDAVPRDADLKLSFAF